MGNLCVELGVIALLAKSVQLPSELRKRAGCQIRRHQQTASCEHWAWAILRSEVLLFRADE